MSQPSSEHEQRVRPTSRKARDEREIVTALNHPRHMQPAAYDHVPVDRGALKRLVESERDCRAALAESQEREKVLLIENTNMSGLADEMDALQQQHDALRACAEALRAAYTADALADWFTDDAQDGINVWAVLHAAGMFGEAASGEPTPPQGGRPE